MRSEGKKEIIHGDCLELMKDIPTASVDMILCDLPYGTTKCKWDVIIPFEMLWEQYERVIKDNGAIVLTAAQPFTSLLVMSNLKLFKYEWIYTKTKGVGYLNANKMPITNHENILVFYKKSPIYNPQYSKGKPYKRVHRTEKDESTYGKSTRKNGHTLINEGVRYPTTSIDKISNPSGKGQLHPTQKPIELFEYLIKTYTNEGDLVLDNCAGSGTTGVACMNTERNFILIEKELQYVETIKNRLNEIRNRQENRQDAKVIDTRNQYSKNENKFCNNTLF